MKTNNIYQGDCVELIKELPDNSIDAIIIDPPYCYLDGHKLDKEFDELALFKEYKRVLKDGKLAIFGRGATFYKRNAMLLDLGFTFKEEFIWQKSSPSSAVGIVSRVHETIAVFSDTAMNKVFVDYLTYKQSATNGMERIMIDIRLLQQAYKKKGKSFLEKSIKALTGEIPMRDMYDGGKFKETHNITQKLSETKLRREDRGFTALKSMTRGMPLQSIINCKKESFRIAHPTSKHTQHLSLIHI